MQHKEFLTKQLRSTAEAVIWTTSQIPTGRYNVIPLPAFGEHSVLRLVYHLVWTERNLAVPIVRQWVTNTEFDAEPFTGSLEEKTWETNDMSMKELMEDFSTRNALQLRLISGLEEDDWHKRRRTPWGYYSLYWMTANVIQRRMETTNTLMKMSLYWDIYLDMQEQTRLDERDETRIDQQQAEQQANRFSARDSRRDISELPTKRFDE